MSAASTFHQYPYIVGLLTASDDVILRELARSEGSSPDKQETFLAGLRELITDLRKRNIGSLTDIASAIIAYRKDFLADEFRVLPL